MPIFLSRSRLSADGVRLYRGLRSAVQLLPYAREKSP